MVTDQILIGSFALPTIPLEPRSTMSIRGGPPLSNTRTSLPQIQSKFDLEPNPFEQSFKDSPAEPTHPPQHNTNSPSLDHLLNGSQPPKARSSSPTHFSPENRLSPPVIRHTPGGSAVKVSLPGINSIASPAILLHHTGRSTPKSLSPPSQSTSQSAQSSLPASMPPYNWTFGVLGDSLRTGPLSPALLNGPAPVRASNPIPHTGLTPSMDIDSTNGNGTITPGTQALLAILSGNDQDASDIRSPAGHSSLPIAGVASSNNPTDPTSHKQAHRPINPADQGVASITTLKASHISESLHSAHEKFAGSALHSKDSTSKLPASSLQDPPHSSTSTNRSSLSPQTHHHKPSSTVPPCSRLAPVSAVSLNDSSTSPPSTSAHLRRDSLNSCNPSSMAASVGPSAATCLNSVSSLGLSQSAIPTIGPYSCTAGTSRSSFPQTLMPLSIPPAPSLQSSAEVVTPLSPSSTHRKTMNALRPGSGDRIDDHYTANPLYLLTVAHEASSRMSQLSNNRESHQHDSMDDATATAAAALTGLGSSGGSRYSSPGPTINPNGIINPHLINNIQNAQSALLKHVDGGSSITSPSLSSQRPNPLPDSSSIRPGVILCPDSGVPLLSAHNDSPFATDPTGVHSLNSFPSQAGCSSSNSTSHISFPSNYPNSHIGSLVPMNMPDSSSAQQSVSSLGLSAPKKKGKKRKENGQVVPEESQQCNMNGQDAGQAQAFKGDLESSPSVAHSSLSRSASKAPRTGRPLHKAKKLKKSKPEDSGDDSDSRDAYWGTEEDRTYMKQQGTEDGEFAGYNGNAHAGANYDPDHPPPPAQSSASGKPETEEEKRKNFLERNRQAALKCRQRKKAWLANLQTKVEYLSTENENLQLTINSLREEIDSFRSILVSHKDCPITVGGGRGASTTIGELVGREPGLVAASAAAILAQQHHHDARAALRQPQPPNSIHVSAQLSGVLTSTNGTIVQSHHTPHGTVTSSYGY
ncbi:hypothetical protein VP01_1734g2 [Puccinia sorghi]|uniref:BZIP domain-containing protein n=1 Tax=Puccinia sorghi TaxID=27349 RepID=A0A0L6VF67_9BASI|nr:hypothetical protein VP01_1734g2 [Puccinia sorghi]